eukprot:1159401-Pelagomonas_calceolata.AAC.6
MVVALGCVPAPDEVHIVMDTSAGAHMVAFQQLCVRSEELAHRLSAPEEPGKAVPPMCLLAFQHGVYLLSPLSVPLRCLPSVSSWGVPPESPLSASQVPSECLLTVELLHWKIAAGDGRHGGTLLPLHLQAQEMCAGIPLGVKVVLKALKPSSRGKTESRVPGACVR